MNRNLFVLEILGKRMDSLKDKLSIGVLVVSIGFFLSLLPAQALGAILAEPAYTTGTQNTIYWDAEPGATTYTVVCDDASDFASPLTTWTVSAPTTERTFSSLVDDQTYWYRLRAEDSFGVGSWSASTSSTQDATLPSVTLSSSAPDPVRDLPISLTATFSEAVTGFDASDITVVNCSVSNFNGSGSIYTFDLIPDDYLVISAQIAANVSQDQAGNLNTVSNQLTRTHSRWKLMGSANTVTSAFNGAMSVCSTDMDGDGDMDILAGSYYLTGGVRWWENTAGNGSAWTERVIDSSFVGVFSVIAADMDGDGDMDVLGVSGTQNELAWWENTSGDGTAWFKRTMTSAVARGCSVHAADMDHDGDTDVLVASFDSDYIELWENTTGDATTWNTSSVATSFGGARSVSAADMDGDGDLDVLGAAFWDDDVAWWENTAGDASAWSIHTVNPSFSRAFNACAADMDGDGDMDVVATARVGNEVRWWENTSGDGTAWTTHLIKSNFGGAYSVFTVDMDNDGDQDVLATAGVDNDVTWWENTAADGTIWKEHMIDGLFTDTRSACAADIDGDGDMDTIAASVGDDSVTWWENSLIHRNAVYTDEMVITSLADGAFSAQGADFDGDGDLDILSASPTDNKVAWHENRLNELSIDFGPQQVISTDGVSPRSAHAADLDGDGDPDVLAASVDDDEIAWYENGLDEVSADFTTRTIISTSADGPSSVFASDLDGDGDLDALSASLNDNTIAWYENRLNEGSADFGPQRVLTTTATQASSVFACDLDGDGDPDVLSASMGDDTIAWYENRLNEISTDFSSAQILTNTADQAASVHAADIDGDGDLDVLSASSGDDTIAWYENRLNEGTADFAPLQSISTSCDGASSVYTGDLDLDGDIDVLCASQNDNSISWFENLDGAGSFGPRTIISATASGAMGVFAGDLDGDGDLDALSASASDDSIAWYENQGGQFALQITDTAPALFYQGDTDDLLRFSATHNGNLSPYAGLTGDDTDIELASLTLMLEESPGNPLSSAEANSIIESLHVYADDGSGDFDPILDTLIGSLATLSLDPSGILTLLINDGDLDAATAPTLSSPYYFVVAKLSSNAASRTPEQFMITYLAVSNGTCEDRDNDLPLKMQTGQDTASSIVTIFGAPAPPSDPTGNPDSMTQITWGWTDNAIDEEDYLIHTDPGAGPPSTLRATLPIDTETWTQNALLVNTAYSMQAAASNTTGTSFKTDNLIVYTLIEPLSGLTVSAATATEISVGPSNTPSNLLSGQSGILLDNTTAGTNSGWQQSTAAWNSTALTPNTLYDFEGKSRNGDAIETASVSISGRTLAATASVGNSVSCDRTPGAWYPDLTDFTFTNPAGFGAGTHGGSHYQVSKFRYAWDTSAAYAFTGFESEWSTGSLVQSPSDSGSYYLHLQSLNAADSANPSTLDYGPFNIDMESPASTILTPTTGALFMTNASPLTTLSGTASDTGGSALASVTWTSDQGGSGPVSGTTNWTVLSIPLALGVNTITITATDGAGNSSSAFLTLIYDIDSPNVSIESPTADAAYTTTSASLALLAGTASDTGGAELASLTWSSDQDHSGALQGTDNWSTLTVPLEPGDNVITVTAIDGAGNASNDVLTVTYDDIPPFITIAAPTTDPTWATNSSVLDIAGGAGDTGGSDLASVTWVSDQGPAGTAFVTTGWTITGLSLLPGVNVITVTATDGIGNTASDVLTVTYDNESPTADINTPTTSSNWASSASSLSIAGKADDTGGSALATVGWSNSLGGGGSQAGSANWFFSNIPLQTGLINVITITVTDGAGNTGTDTLSVTQDSEAPSVSISAPTPSASWMTNSNILTTLSGNASDSGLSGLASITCVNDRSVGSISVTGTTNWSVPNLTLSLGDNLITITATDGAGNTAIDSLTVTYDTNFPTLSITSPTPGVTLLMNSPTFPTLSGTSSDTGGSGQGTVTWSNDKGGTGTAIGTANWSISGIPLQPGLNTITVSTTDGAGNKTSKAIAALYDAQPPVVTIQTPTSANTYTAPTNPLALLAGIATDPGGSALTSIAWSNDRGGQGTATGTSDWSVSDLTLQPGDNLITVTATDGAGNTATDQLTVTTEALPAAPSNPDVKGITTSEITWIWQDNSSNEAGFRLYSGQGPTAPITSPLDLSANLTEWSLTGLTPNSQHAFQLLSFSTGGESAKTTNFTTWTLAATPKAPSLTAPTTTTLNLEIGAGDQNPASTQYAVFNFTDGSWLQLEGTVWHTAAQWGTFTVQGLRFNKEYKFRVLARNEAQVMTLLGPVASGRTEKLPTPPKPAPPAGVKEWTLYR